MEAVLGLVAEELANKVVAARLDVAEKTVKVHRARAMKKVGATSLADLIFLAVSRRLVEAHDGRIWARRAGKRGLVVAFELPISRG